MKKALLEATDLCKTYSNESVQQHVIKNLNLKIYEGDFTVIMGNSGSGKSTLLYSLSGMDRPTLGQIRYGDEDISGYSNNKLAVFRRNHCGFVFQQNYLNDTMSALDNVMVSGLLINKNRKELAARAKELLTQVEITEQDWKKFPSQLSGGQQQRCAIARALVKNPKVLLCDEPTGALDSKTSRDILVLLEKINRQYGTTMLIVTHNNSIKNMVDHVIYLKDGEIYKDYKNETKVPASELEDL